MTTRTLLVQVEIKALGSTVAAVVDTLIQRDVRLGDERWWETAIQESAILREEWVLRS